MYPDSVRDQWRPDIDIVAMMDEIFTDRRDTRPVRLGNARKRVRIAPEEKRKSRKAQRAARRNNR